MQLAPQGPKDLFSAVFQLHQRNMFGSRQRQKIKLIPAEETVNFERLDESDGIMTVRRTYQLVTLDDEKTPLMEVKGVGEIQFDVSLGVPIAGNYSGEVVHNTNGNREVTPVKVQFDRITKEN